MSIYYIYAYLREDGTPYYIGKGKNKRAFEQQNHLIAVPKIKSQIVIMENNLTEIGALALERFYIRWYGRKDLHTGILRNLTDGGEGTSGRVHSDDTKSKIRNSVKGFKHTDEAKRKMRDRKLSENTKRKMSESHKGKTLSEEHKMKLLKANLGRQVSEETRKKISEAKKIGFMNRKNIVEID